MATVIKTRPHLHVFADEPDNRILECAVEAAAEFVVTGEKHLLSLRKFQDIRIIEGEVIEGLQRGEIFP